MKYRKFGSLDWNVSEIGLGCWQIGADWGNVSEDKANEVIQSSFENGVNFFDTADVYGDGRSEKFVGKFINSISDRIYVATKAGRRINPHVANGYYDKNLMESFVDRSLLNLNIETIDPYTMDRNHMEKIKRSIDRIEKINKPTLETNMNQKTESESDSE